MRARADRAMSIILLTVLEQVPVQGYAGRWLKVMDCAGNQSKDGDPVALMAALGLMQKKSGLGVSNRPQGKGGGSGWKQGSVISLWEGCC